MQDAPEIRLAVFLGLFGLLALAEYMLPRRNRVAPQPSRWITNWAISFLNIALLRGFAVVLPFLAVGAAADAAGAGWGLLNWLDWNLWIEGLLAFLVLDFLIWAQHVASHKLPWFWRLHRVHHADRDVDVTTAIRFHPLEIGLSMLIKIAAVYLLGPSVIAVIVFEIVLNGCAMFNHANLALPRWLDRALRPVIVTPDMHRVHHSVNRAEHDTNYGFALSCWDRMFGVYTDQPKHGHAEMTLGLQWQDDRPSRLGWSLWLPFR